MKETTYKNGHKNVVDLLNFYTYCPISQFARVNLAIAVRYYETFTLSSFAAPSPVDFGTSVMSVVLTTTSVEVLVSVTRLVVVNESRLICVVVAVTVACDC